MVARWTIQLACVLALGFGAAASGDDLPTVEQIRQSLRDWRRDFVVFRIRFQVGTGAGTHVKREFLMTDSHEFLNVREDHWPDGEKPLEHVFEGGNVEVLRKLATEDWREALTRQVTGGNRDKRFHATYRSTSEGKWYLTGITEMPRQTANVATMWTVMPLYLLFDPFYGRWMDEFYFSDNHVEVIGRELVEGEPCVKLAVTYRRDGEVWGLGSTLWLAEEKNYLIKRVVPNPDESNGRRDVDWICTNFAQLDGIWYPEHGTNGSGTYEQRWDVEEFAINFPVNSAMFRAPDRSALVRTKRPPVAEQASAGGPAMTATKTGDPGAVPLATPEHDWTRVWQIGLGLVGCALILFWWVTRPR